jgi:hypothetical protein
VTYTTPFTAVTGATIASADWNTSARDNIIHLRALLPDAASSGQVLVSTATTTAAFGTVAADGLASDAVTTAKILDANVTTAKLAAESVTEAKLDALDSPADNEILTYDSATARLEWQAASALITGFPASGILAFATAAAIASGFSRYTAADGRFLVGAGTSFSVTYTENTAYGSSWSHQHAATGLTATGANTGAASTTQANLKTVSPQEEAAAGTDHVHPAGAITMGGNTANTAWTIPSYAVVWAQKS